MKYKSAPYAEESLNRILYDDNIKDINHDKKLFQDRMEKSFKIQRIFLYKYFWIGYWHGL